MKSKKFSLVIKESIKDFKKTIVVDSDKSTSIRSFLLGSISQGISSVKNVLESEDVYSTINCLKKLGVTIKKDKDKSYSIHGKGLGYQVYDSPDGLQRDLPPVFPGQPGAA